MTISPKIILENIGSSPETLGLLRRFAKEQGISMEQSFTGTPKPRRIALLSKKQIKNEKLTLDNRTDSKNLNRELNRVLKDYFKNQ